MFSPPCCSSSSHLRFSGRPDLRILALPATLLPPHCATTEGTAAATMAACIKSVPRSALAAFSPEAPYLATGTMAGAVDLSFSSSANLEIFKMDLRGDGHELPLAGACPSGERFHRLSWGRPPTSPSEDYALGLVAGGLVDGSISIWNPLRLISARYVRRPDGLGSILRPPGFSYLLAFSATLVGIGRFFSRNDSGKPFSNFSSGEVDDALVSRLEKHRGPVSSSSCYIIETLPPCTCLQHKNLLFMAGPWPRILQSFTKSAGFWG